MNRSNDQHAAWLRRGGVEPTDLLMRENRENALKEERDNSIQEITKARDHTLKGLKRNHKKRMSTIKRKIRQDRYAHRIKMCLPIALMFGLIAWYCFSHSDFIMGIWYVVGMLAFLAIVVV